MRPETRKLRVVSVAARCTLQHLLGEQRLAPRRDQPLCVEVAGMDRV